MKIKEVIQRVQSLYSKGAQSDDSRLSSRHIYSKIKTIRTKLLTQKAKKKQAISQWNYQTLPCVELVSVPAHQCPCLPPIGCDILRSKHPLPKPLIGLSTDLIQNVTTIDRSLKIDRIGINALNSQKGNKYTSKKVNYFIFEDYLYISTPSKIKVVSLTGLFEDPIDVHSFKSYCEAVPCVDCDSNCIDYLEAEFKIDVDLIDTLVELSVQELIGVFSKSREDLTNNSVDNLKQESK